MSTLALPRRIATSSALVTTVGAIAVLALSAQRMGGADGYLTDPLATLALAGAAVLADVSRRRLAASGRTRAARFAAILVGSLLFALVCAAVAVAAASTPGVFGSGAVAVWSVSWIPPLVLSQLVASAAIRPDTSSPRLHILVLITSAIAIVAGLALWQPIDPFAGVSPIAPDAWATRLALVGGLVTVGGFAGLLLLPISLARAAVTSRDRARARLGVAAAGTAAAPLVVIFCVALAIAGDPGGVDPSAGSVAFLVAVAIAGAAGATCALLIARPLAPPHVTTVVRAALLTAAALVVAAAGTLVVAAGWAPTPTALLVAALAVAGFGGAWAAGGRVAAALQGGMGCACRPRLVRNTVLATRHPSRLLPPHRPRARRALPARRRIEQCGNRQPARRLGAHRRRPSAGDFHEAAADS